MGDSVGDYPGFSAAGAGQDQQRTLGVFDGLLLAGIESVKKIHRKSNFTMPVMSLSCKCFAVCRV